MKRIICVIFLLSILSTVLITYRLEIEDISLIKNVQSIKLITGDNEGFDGVFNGNKLIADIEDFSEITSSNVDGFTITMTNQNFNLYQFIVNNNILIDKIYSVYDSKVYDCKLIKTTIYNYNTMQLVVNKDSVVIGIPMILNSF